MTTELFLAVLSLGLLMFQGTATLILLGRLIKGATRLPPLEPRKASPDILGKVSVVVPTLNERERLAPCLKGLGEQGYEVREVLFIDSYSVDGTIELIKEAAQNDPRFRLLHDDPLPPGWVGRPWALNYGFRQSSQESEWVLGLDADTLPQRGLIPSLLEAAKDYDIISLSPQFILKEAGEWLLQPALLMTLLYRFDSAGVTKLTVPEQVMANGQCLLCRRKVLEALDGYSIAAGSFCDDVTLVRYAATQGYRVGFLDGSRLLHVRMYEGIKDTWSGWGRSLDLKDASSNFTLWGDLAILLLVQGLPIPIFLLLSLNLNIVVDYTFWSLKLAWALNLFLIVVRFALLLAISPSYLRASKPQEWLFWLSPLFDPIAVVRIFLSATSRPKQWRGRQY